MATDGQGEHCQKAGGLWVLSLLSRQFEPRPDIFLNCRAGPELRAPWWLCVLDLQIQADHCQGFHAGMASLLDTTGHVGTAVGKGPTAASPGMCSGPIEHQQGLVSLSVGAAISTSTGKCKASSKAPLVEPKRGPQATRARRQQSL